LSFATISFGSDDRWHLVRRDRGWELEDVQPLLDVRGSIV
jgi:hypothetical protein